MATSPSPTASSSSSLIDSRESRANPADRCWQCAPTTRGETSSDSSTSAPPPNATHATVPPHGCFETGVGNANETTLARRRRPPQCCHGTHPHPCKQHPPQHSHNLQGGQAVINSAQDNDGNFGDDEDIPAAKRAAMASAVALRACAGGSPLEPPKSAAEVDFDICDPPEEHVVPPGISAALDSATMMTENDVLCGRGGGTNSQMGNRRFRALVRDFQPTYLMAKRKEKPKMARSVVLIIRNRGGRFLRRDDTDGRLYEVGDLKAEAKTSQALREGLDVRATKTAAKTLMGTVGEDCCTHEGCTNKSQYRGKCRRHYDETPACSHEKCPNKAVYKESCMRHHLEHRLQTARPTNHNYSLIRGISKRYADGFTNGGTEADVAKDLIAVHSSSQKDIPSPAALDQRDLDILNSYIYELHGDLDKLSRERRHELEKALAAIVTELDREKSCKLDEAREECDNNLLLADKMSNPHNAMCRQLLEGNHSKLVGEVNERYSSLVESKKEEVTSQINAKYDLEFQRRNESLQEAEGWRMIPSNENDHLHSDDIMDDGNDDICMTSGDQVRVGRSLNNCVGAKCCFCLGEGPDELGQLPRRDCSCHGESAGFAHLSCIVKYAKQKSQQFREGMSWEDLTEPWEYCPTCKQQYQDKLAFDLANEFAIYVEDEHPGDQQKCLWSLYRKLVSITSIEAYHVHLLAKLIATQLFSIIEQMRTEAPFLPNDILQMEASVYSRLGHIALGEGKREDALLHFRKSLDMYRDVDCNEGVNVVKDIIARINALARASVAATLVHAGNKRRRCPTDNHPRRCPTDDHPLVAQPNTINVIPFGRYSPNTEALNGLEGQIAKCVVTGDRLGEIEGCRVNLHEPCICVDVKRTEVYESDGLAEALATALSCPVGSPVKIVINDTMRSGRQANHTRYFFAVIRELNKLGRNIEVVFVQCYVPSDEVCGPNPVAYSEAVEDREESYSEINRRYNADLAREGIRPMNSKITDRSVPGESEIQSFVYDQAQRIDSSISEEDDINAALIRGKSLYQSLCDVVKKIRVLWIDVVGEVLSGKYPSGSQELKLRVDAFVDEGQKLLKGFRFPRKLLLNYCRCSFLDSDDNSYNVRRFSNQVPRDQACTNRAAERYLLQFILKADYSLFDSALLLDDGKSKCCIDNDELVLGVTLLLSGCVEIFSAKKPERVVDKSIVNEVLMLVCNNDNVNARLVFSACIDKDDKKTLDIASAWERRMEARDTATSVCNSKIEEMEQRIAKASPEEYLIYREFNNYSGMVERKNIGGGDNVLAGYLRRAKQEKEARSEARVRTKVSNQIEKQEKEARTEAKRMKRVEAKRVKLAKAVKEKQDKEAWMKRMMWLEAQRVKAEELRNCGMEKRR